MDNTRRGGVVSVSERYNTTPATKAPPSPPQPFPQDQPTRVPAKGLKIQNINQIAREREQKERENILADFNINADQAIEYDTDLKKRTAELTQRFMSMSDSKILKRNKTNVNIGVENQIKLELLKFGMELNNNFDYRSPDAQFGIGSISILAMLVNVLLQQRDRINDLEYDYKALQQQFLDLKKDLGG
jgi:hypothetical protein